MTPTGATRWLPAASVTTSADGRTTFTLPTPTRIGGLVVENRGRRPVRFDAPTLVTEEDGEVVFDGRLQGDGQPAPLGVHRDHRQLRGLPQHPGPGWAWAKGDGGLGAGRHRGAAAAPDLQGGQRVVVHATGPVRLVRSVSWTTGWHATAQQIDPASGWPIGPPVTVAVHQDEAIQRVDLPAAGSYVVTFSYRTLSAVVGMVISLVTGVGLLAWAVAEAVGIRRRRRRRAAAALTPG